MKCKAKCKPNKPKYKPTFAQLSLKLIDQTQDLNLTKESAQLLRSRLRENNLLAPSTTYFWYRNRCKEFIKYINCDEDHSLVHCQEIQGVILALVINYIAAKCRLFLDSSVKSLKQYYYTMGIRLVMSQLDIQ